MESRTTDAAAIEPQQTVYVTRTTGSESESDITEIAAPGTKRRVVIESITARSGTGAAQVVTIAASNGSSNKLEFQLTSNGNTIHLPGLNFRCDADDLPTITSDAIVGATTIRLSINYYYASVA